VPELDGYGLRLHIVRCADEVKPALTKILARYVLHYKQL
jgi:hypothetical protein